MKKKSVNNPDCDDQKRIKKYRRRAHIIVDQNESKQCLKVMATVCRSMSLHLFLHSNALFVSLGKGYELCKLNFLMRYMICHLIGKHALEIMSEQTRRAWKSFQIASIWPRKRHLEGLRQRLRDQKSNLPRPKGSRGDFSQFWQGIVGSKMEPKSIKN